MTRVSWEGLGGQRKKKNGATTHMRQYHSTFSPLPKSLRLAFGLAEFVIDECLNEFKRVKGYLGKNYRIMRFYNGKETVLGLKSKRA